MDSFSAFEKELVIAVSPQLRGRPLFSRFARNVYDVVRKCSATIPAAKNVEQLERDIKILRRAEEVLIRRSTGAVPIWTTGLSDQSEIEASSEFTELAAEAKGQFCDVRLILEERLQAMRPKRGRTASDKLSDPILCLYEAFVDHPVDLSNDGDFHALLRIARQYSGENDPDELERTLRRLKETR